MKTLWLVLRCVLLRIRALFLKRYLFELPFSSIAFAQDIAGISIQGMVTATNRRGRWALWEDDMHLSWRVRCERRPREYPDRGILWREVKE